MDFPIFKYCVIALMNNCVAFFHVATIGKYQEVYNELIQTIVSSGLYNYLDHLFVGIVGDKPVDGLGLDKLQILYQGENLDNYEFLTLRKLQILAYSCTNHRILYIHTKGLTTAGYSEAISDWRRYMAYFVIERYKDCLGFLENYDVCGVDWRTNPAPHFSGNFWWATSEYIRRLPSIEDISQVGAKQVISTSLRHNAEMWIGMSDTVNAKSLYDCGVDVYERPFHTLKKEVYSQVML